MIAFLYARVSTVDQDPGMQLREMGAYAAARKWTAESFEDHVSGTKDRRPCLDSMMEKVRRRKCDIVLVYKFDRFARSLSHLLRALEEFDALGIAFVSLHDHVDTTTASGRLMFQIIGAFAEFERSIIQQRVRSGMANARAKGVHVGRPSLGLDPSEITLLRAQGLTWGEIADRVGAGESTVRKFMQREAEKGCGKPPNESADSKGFVVPVEKLIETPEKKTF